ncbi:MAG: AMP-binding protein [Eggerthellaceae bacterium]|nr:AMP-binding protein [Eggerthellaceae bacterium]
MIDTFENIVRTTPHSTFFTVVGQQGEGHSYNYRNSRLVSAAMAHHMTEAGVRPNDSVVIDLPNCPEFVFLLLAAAYGSFNLVCLNHRLTSFEKDMRVRELERCGLNIACTINHRNAKRLFNYVCTMLEYGDEGTHRLNDGLNLQTPYQMHEHDLSHKSRNILGTNKDAYEDTIHFAERSSHLFDSARTAIIMFTSGTTGKPKAVPLSWQQLSGSAIASNISLTPCGTSIWQAVLPLYHIGGLEIIVRSIFSRTPFRLFRHFDAREVLEDFKAFPVTNISVVDKMLQDLLDVDEEGVLSGYHCILLGGGPVNPATLQRCIDANIRVYPSYGMTETCSQIANHCALSGYDGGLNLLRDYEGYIVDPGPDGFGQLAVKGPGVFDGYLNAPTPFTMDGCFLTGDRARIEDGKLYISERLTDMFISGGENVYPAEIISAALTIPGIGAAHCFGVSDEKWGRRPVLMVEPASELAAQSLNPLVIKNALKSKLSPFSMPEKVLVVDELPRTVIGKVDRIKAQELYESRLEMSATDLFRIKMPFKVPFRNSKVALDERDALIIRVKDAQGSYGLGECSSFMSAWYLPETLEQDMKILSDILIPVMQNEAFMHPRDVGKTLASIQEAQAYPMARAALEMACWDLYGKKMNIPLWRLLRNEYHRLERELLGREQNCSKSTAIIGQTSARVMSGVALGIDSAEDTLKKAARSINEGYARIKLKISPNHGYDCAQAIRRAYPNILISLDANQSFKPFETGQLKRYDPLNIAWIEEPVNAGTGSSAFRRIAEVQRQIETPLCIDESYLNQEQAY